MWVLLLGAAVLNGGIREALIIPRTGDLAGHAISTVSLCLLILLIGWITVGWISPVSPREAWVIGSVWVVLVVAFEFIAGHYLFGTSWDRLFENYNVARGRIWPLVLVTTAVTPYIAGRLRGLWF